MTGLRHTNFYKDRDTAPCLAGQDSLSQVGVVNIADSAGTDLMVADFIVDYPAWDSLHVNTVWSGIIRLHSDLFIGPEDTLRILPGTTVVMTPWHDEFHRGQGLDTSRIQICVEGALIAEGAQGDSIFFTTAFDQDRLKTPDYS